MENFYLEEAQLGKILPDLILESLSTHRRVVGATRSRSLYKQSIPRPPANVLHCSWTLAKLRQRNVFDRKLRWSRQSFHSTVLMVGDIGSLQLIEKNFNSLCQCDFRISEQFIILQYLFTTQLCFRNRSGSQHNLNFSLQSQWGFGYSPLHLGIGPDQWPLAKHSKCDGPLRR